MFEKCHAEEEGGSIRSFEGTLVLTNSTFYECNSFEGGAIRASNSTLFLSDADFVENHAHSGGAVFLTGESKDNSLMFLASRFRSNSARLGGAFYASQVSRIIITKQTVLQNNTASSLGGAIYADSQATITISNSLLKENSVGKGGYGGALFLRASSHVLVNDTQFLSNWAANGRAVAASSEISGAQVIMDFNNTIFKDNFANSLGGAIHITGWAVCSLQDCTCDSNLAN